MDYVDVYPSTIWSTVPNSIQCECNLTRSSSSKASYFI